MCNSSCSKLSKSIEKHLPASLYCPCPLHFALPSFACVRKQQHQHNKICMYIHPTTEWLSAPPQSQQPELHRMCLLDFCRCRCIHNTYIYIHIYISIHQYIHTYIHTSIHPSIHPYIHPSIHPSIYPCMHACMHACIHTYIHTYIHRYIYIYIYIYHAAAKE